MSNKFNLEDLDIAIKELEKDPENLCLYYNKKCIPQEKCNGYSSSLICSDYVNIKHIRDFDKFRIE